MNEQEDMEHNWQELRARGEYYLRCSEAILALVPGQYQPGVVLLLVARRCVADWILDGEIAPPAAVTRHSSINAIASSLDRPFETVRRYVGSLVEHGYLVRTTQGVALAEEGARVPAIMAFLRAMHDNILTLIGDLHDAQVPLPPVPAAQDVDTLAIVQTGMDVFLAPFEHQRVMIDHWVQGIVFLAISVEASHAIYRDPVLSRRYRYRNTPDAMRGSISVRQIAARLGIPYSTVWRYAQQLEADGRVTRTGAQEWSVLIANLVNERIEKGNSAYLTHLHRTIRRLIVAGLDPVHVDERRLRASAPAHVQSVGV